MDTKIETIDPAKAERWLNENKVNRKLREGIVELYAKDMRNGNWTQCPVPISFYADGDLADGQHRLWAIVESQTTQTFNVTRGLSKADGLNIDTGLTRSLVDAARISGLQVGMSNMATSVSRAVATGTAAVGRMSNAEKLQLYEAHKEAVDWAIAHGPTGLRLRNSVTLGAVARAYVWEEDKARLKRFCEVLSTGFQNGDDEAAAIAMRNYILAKEGTFSTSALWQDSFFKTQTAIHNFMKRRKVMVIRGVGEEAYPLKKKPQVRRSNKK